MTFSRDMIDVRKERHRIYSHLRRAEEIGAPATLTLDEWINTILLFQGLCAYCRKEPFETLDHLYPICAGGGTTQSNSVPACVSCNAKKGSKIGDDVSDARNLMEAAEKTLSSLRRNPDVYQDRYKYLGEYIKTPIWTSPLLKKRLQNIAKKEYRTLSNQILYILEQHFEQLEKEDEVP